MAAAKTVSGRRALAARQARATRAAARTTRVANRTASKVARPARRVAPTPARAVASVARRTASPAVEAHTAPVPRTSGRQAGDRVSTPVRRVPSTQEIRRLATTIADTLQGLPVEAFDRVLTQARTEAEHHAKAEQAEAERTRAARPLRRVA